MILIREIATGEWQVVESLDGYDTALFEDHGEPPEGLAEGWMRHDGTAWVEDWSRIDAALHAKVDAAAGEHRKKFITTAPGQEMTYLNKEKEARAFVAGEAAGPMIAAEAQALGKTVDQLAQEVIANAEAWAQLGAAIEATRLGAKAAITAATTYQAKLDASEVTWPVP